VRGRPAAGPDRAYCRTVTRSPQAPAADFLRHLDDGERTVFRSPDPARFDTAPCGRCGRLTECRKLGRVWWLPLWAMTLTLASPGKEGQRLYCARCRKRLNWCLAFLGLMGTSAVLLFLFK
jgi:hypothetical protein